MSMKLATKSTFDLGGDLTVNRLGFGAMRLTGPGAWGDPADRAESLRILRRAVELGVNLIDTADAYGPYVSEDLIREALHPYEGVTIATKGGTVRTGPNQSVMLPVGRPEYLRQCVEMSLRRLGLERIDLYQLHRIDPQIPAEDQIGVLKDMHDEGKIRHIGLSEVTVPEIENARKITPIVSVQNNYQLTNRQHEDVLDYCEREDIGFIPFQPLAAGDLAKPRGPLNQIAKETGATPSQLTLAWMLRRSPVMLPIPGTGSMAHLEENCRATDVSLTQKQFAAIAAAI